MPHHRSPFIMLVDDNDTDNLINKRILELTGFADQIVVENSGRSALDCLRERHSKGDRLPDYIFLDINMPVVDGFVFLREYEQFMHDAAHRCKIVVLSSSDSRHDIERIVGTGQVVRFVTKPLSPQVLSELRTDHLAAG